MLGNFVRRSADQKQRVNKKQNVWNRQSCLMRRSGEVREIW